MAILILRLLEEWRSQFLGKKNLTLRIAGGSFYDLIIVPEKYGYRGPMWFAQLAVRLFPSPELYMLLDWAEEELLTEKQYVPPAEALGKRQAYHSFVKTRKKHVILDASTPVANVTEDAYTAIIDMLAQRTDRQLGSRFQQLYRNAEK
jgi:hypothetical protein